MADRKILFAPLDEAQANTFHMDAEIYEFLTMPPGQNPLEAISDALKVRQQKDNARSIPDMFEGADRRAHDLLYNLDSDDGTDSRGRKVLNEWMGLLCALMLAPKDALRTRQYTLDEAMPDGLPVYSLLVDGEKNDTLLMRALAIAMKDRGIATLTMYEARVSGDDRPWRAIGYAYVKDDGSPMPLLICPAANLHAGIGPVLDMDGYGFFSNGSFANPVEQLEKPYFARQARLVADALDSMANHFLGNHDRAGQARGILRAYAARLRAGGQATELTPFPHNGCPLPCYTPAADNPDATTAMLRTWFTDHLLLLREQAEMFENAYGSFPQQNVNAEDGIKGEERRNVLLPLTDAFARAAADAPQLLSELDADMRVRQHKTRRGYQFVIHYRFSGHEYTRTYEQDECISPRFAQNRMLPLPYAAVWPDAPDTDGGWDEYYLYCDYSLGYATPEEGEWADQDITLAPLVWDGQGTPREAQSDGSPATKDFRHVTRLGQFPQFIRVRHGDVPVGLLLPKPNTLDPATNTQWTIAVDFGSTSTVAYRYDPGNPGGKPGAITIESNLLKVCGVPPASYNETLLLRFKRADNNIDERFMTALSLQDGQARERADIEAFTDAIIPFTQRCTLGLAERMVRVGLKRNTDEHDNLTNADRAMQRVFLEELLLCYGWYARRRGIKPANITWRFATPKSMNPNIRSNLIALFRGAAERAGGRLWPSTAESTEADAVGAYITHERTTEKLSNHHGKIFQTRDPHLIIDVGGGTVDFSLWQQDERGAQNVLLLDASMRAVASDYVLRDSLWDGHTIKIISELMSKKIELPSDAVKSNLERLANKNAELTGNLFEVLTSLKLAHDNGQEQDADIEILRSRFDTAWALMNQDLIEDLNKKLKETAYVGDEKNAGPYMAYKRRIQMNFLAYAFFAGEMAGAALRAGALGFAPETQPRLWLLWGGNGSRVVEHFMPEDGIAFHEHVRDAFFAGLCDAGATPPEGMDLAVVNPLIPKQEVAFGLCLVADKPDHPDNAPLLRYNAAQRSADFMNTVEALLNLVDDKFLRPSTDGRVRQDEWRRGVEKYKDDYRARARNILSKYSDEERDGLFAALLRQDMPLPVPEQYKEI